MKPLTQWSVGRPELPDVRPSVREEVEEIDSTPPTRYATVYSSFFEGLAAATEGLRNFIEGRPGDARRRYLRRGDRSGPAQLLPPRAELRRDHGGGGAGDGLTLDELRSRSFVKILKARRRMSPRA